MEDDAAVVERHVEEVVDEVQRLIDVAQIRTKAWKLCRNFLQGAWANIQPEEMEIDEICGGLSNLMYYCSLPSHIQPKGREPSEVLLRIFGKALKEHDSASSESYLTGLVIESVIFTLLSERKLGPKLMGVFPGGRLEEYIPAKSMRSSHIRTKKFSDAIARKVGKFHRLSVPINKDAGWLFKTMTKWHQTMSKIDLDDVTDPRERVLAEQLLAKDFTTEIEWLRKAVERVNSPLVFCHNDLQCGNILLREDADSLPSVDDAIVIIDYEFCSYNYRAFDIANHLYEWMFDYNIKVWPFYHFEEDKFPSKEKQMDFLRIYLQQYLSDDQSPPMPTTPTSTTTSANCVRRNVRQLTLEQQVQTLYKEVQTFLAATNLMWSLWSIANAVDSKIVFGNWSYASDRMDRYFREKARIMTEYEHDVANGKRHHED